MLYIKLYITFKLFKKYVLSSLEKQILLKSIILWFKGRSSENELTIPLILLHYSFILLCFCLMLWTLSV